MIKKILVTALVNSFMIANANAAPLMCPFTDYFTMQGASVGALYVDGNLSGSVTDIYHFTTSCRNNGSTGSGHAYLTASRGGHYCYLTILDGPFENNPIVLSADCTSGLNYVGMDHVTGTYSYTLKFY